MMHGVWCLYICFVTCLYACTGGSCKSVHLRNLSTASLCPATIHRHCSMVVCLFVCLFVCFHHYKTKQAGFSVVQSEYCVGGIGARTRVCVCVVPHVSVCHVGFACVHVLILLPRPCSILCLYQLCCHM